MLVKTYCAAVNGLNATVITIEVNKTRGVMLHLTGLPDNAVRESRDRIAESDAKAAAKAKKNSQAKQETKEQQNEREDH